MFETLLRGVCVCAVAATGALGATPAAAAGRGCGTAQSDWDVRHYGFTGDVHVTTAFGEEPAGTHQRFLDVSRFAEIAVRTAEADAFEGYGAFDGAAGLIWERGYRWRVPATEWSPGGVASFLGPACRAGTTIVESAIYRFEAGDSADDGVAWGVLTRDF